MKKLGLLNVFVFSIILFSCDPLKLNEHRIKTHSINTQITWYEVDFENSYVLFKDTSYRDDQIIQFDLELHLEKSVPFNKLFSSYDIQINRERVELRDYDLDFNKESNYKTDYQIVVNQEGIAIENLNELTFSDGITNLSFIFGEDYVDLNTEGKEVQLLILDGYLETNAFRID